MLSAAGSSHDIRAHTSTEIAENFNKFFTFVLLHTSFILHMLTLRFCQIKYKYTKSGFHLDDVVLGKFHVEQGIFSQGIRKIVQLISFN